jgi:ketol-acid reductoisomerase
MAKIYHDDDADLDVLRDQTVAVIGYGNQGRSQALNLRDSGVKVIIGNIRDNARAAALADEFTVSNIGDACAQADVAMLLIPDEIMPEIVEKHVAPNLEAGNLLVFASGYNIAFELIELPADIDVVLVAMRQEMPPRGCSRSPRASGRPAQDVSKCRCTTRRVSTSLPNRDSARRSVACC